MGCIGVGPFEADAQRSVLSVFSWGLTANASRTKRPLTFSQRGIYQVICFEADAASGWDSPGYGGVPFYQNVDTDDGDVYEPFVPSSATLFGHIWVFRRAGGTVTVDLNGTTLEGRRFVFIVLGPPGASVTWGNAV